MHRNDRLLPLSLLAVLVLLQACDGDSASREQTQSPPTEPAVTSFTHAAVDSQRLQAADSEPGQWMSHGRTYSEQRFSPLDQIDRDNVDQLGLAWYADLNVPRTQEATPLMVDGVIYVSTAWSNVHAYDAATGEPLWTYDAQVPGEWGARACCDVVNRGVAVWEGKVFVGTIDGRLVALDAASGEPVWDTNTLIDRDLSYTITGAPRVVKGRVIIGNGGAEYGVRGYVSAYDADTGELDWRFYTVPGNPAEGFENDTMRMAADTWNGEWWTLGGGGTVWDSMAYDPELDLLYIGTGNGSPWNQDIRSPGGGDNLFLSSIVALDPDDGSYVWHYQTTPGETWDYTATQPIVLATLPIDGQDRRVVMQAPKNGFFYVLDAATGEFISGEAFAAVNWASGIDPETGRPVENPRARYDRTGKAFAVQPSSAGAHNWHPMAFSPQTGLAYFSSANNALVYAYDRDFDPDPRTSNLGVDIAAGMAELGPEATADLPGGSHLVAWDPVTQQAAWQIPGESAGVLATAGGLVFKGQEQRLAAYDADSGDALWQSEALHTGIVAAPIAYELDGRQYVAVVAGRSSGYYYAPDYSRLLVFRLDGEASLPPEISYSVPDINPPPAEAPAEQVARGEKAYQDNCIICHGEVGNAGGMFRRGLFPELARSPALQSQALFDSIVLDGVRTENGMASFADVIGPQRSADIRAYLIDRANQAAE